MCELTIKEYYDIFGEHVPDNAEDFVAQIEEIIKKQNIIDIIEKK